MANAYAYGSGSVSLGKHGVGGSNTAPGAGYGASLLTKRVRQSLLTINAVEDAVFEDLELQRASEDAGEFGTQRRDYWYRPVRRDAFPQGQRPSAMRESEIFFVYEPTIKDVQRDAYYVMRQAHLLRGGTLLNNLPRLPGWDGQRVPGNEWLHIEPFNLAFWRDIGLQGLVSTDPEHTNNDRTNVHSGGGVMAMNKGTREIVSGHILLVSLVDQGHIHSTHYDRGRSELGRATLILEPYDPAVLISKLREYIREYTRMHGEDALRPKTFVALCEHHQKDVPKGRFYRSSGLMAVLEDLADGDPYYSATGRLLTDLLFHVTGLRPSESIVTTRKQLGNAVRAAHAAIDRADGKPLNGSLRADLFTPNDAGESVVSAAALKLHAKQHLIIAGALDGKGATVTKLDDLHVPADDADVVGVMFDALSKLYAAYDNFACSCHQDTGIAILLHSPAYMRNLVASLVEYRVIGRALTDAVPGGDFYMQIGRFPS